jgi:SHS2 domain-containing protein
MSFVYRDDIATADSAFQAYGRTVEELFSSAWQALLEVMIQNSGKIKKRMMRNINLKQTSLPMLLLVFLQELLFYKDAEQLFLLVDSINISRTEKFYCLKATLSGEHINKHKNRLGIDVKAITLHKFNLEKTDRGWEATVVLDI